MRFGILGPLLVHDGDADRAVPSARQRVLLAALLVRAGRAVPADELAELVWDGSPPAGAATTLRTHVLRLRQALGPSAGSRVVTRYRGYLAVASDEELDLLHFVRLCRQGGAAVRVGAWADASATLTSALELWRGAPLADIPGRQLCQEEIPRLEQLRLQALEWRADARLRLGCHDELVPELEALTAGNPLRERFHAQLMLALHRSGRRAEALAAYQHARRVLVDELGAEPGAELRELHRGILADDRVLSVRQPADAAAGPDPVMPRQLPAPVGSFTGRESELAALTQLAPARGPVPAAMVISVIAGTAGVGKTALAVSWAHRVASRFPDGQLYVNLRGYDTGQPVAAADALAGFLRALGVPGRDIPAGMDERASTYRSLLAGRRMLVLLDNADSEQRVRPLLPGSPACMALVTSRNSLPGLVALNGARRLQLDVLPAAEAVALLRALIGPRVDADPAAADALAARCGRLPLALRVAAELAAARPAASVADLAAQLASQQRRLDLLDAGGDEQAAVRAVFSWSYQKLDAPAARAFRFMSLHPGPAFDARALAALTATTPGQAGRTIGELVRAHLIQPAGQVRYSAHDLLRVYAADLTARCDRERERRAALSRLFDYYLYAAAAAMDALFPSEQYRRPAVHPPASPAPPVARPAAARDWLDAELPALTAVAAHAADHGWPGHAVRLSAVLFRYLETGGHYTSAVIIGGKARRAAAQTGDLAAEAAALIDQGIARYGLGQRRRAASCLGQALVLFRQAGDQAGLARVLGNLGSLSQRLGSYPQAAGYLRGAVAAYQETGDQPGQARALGNLGAVLFFQGRYGEAARHLRQARDLHHQVGNGPGEAIVLTNLGLVELRQGRYGPAAGHLDQALALSRHRNDPHAGRNTLSILGLVELRQGRYGPAAATCTGRWPCPASGMTCPPRPTR